MMSSSTTIYWYPMGTGTLRTIVLPLVTFVSDEIPVVTHATSETTAGGMHRQLYGDHREITLVRQHIDSTGDNANLLQDLRSLQSHLLAGYSIGVAVGPDRAFGSYESIGIAPGSLVFTVRTNAYLAWSSSSTPVAGDELIIQGQTPYGAREVVEVSNIFAVGSTWSITIDRPTRYNHTGTYLVRHRTFWPHLKLGPDDLGIPLLTSQNNGRTYDFAVNLREDLVEAWSVGQSGQALMGSTDYGEPTPNDIVRGRG